jgi:drug/metabolite transporter (DMT)-like permease
MPLRLLSAAWLPLALAVLFWSGNALLGRALRDDIAPVALAFWRWAVAAALVLPFAWRHLVRDRRVLLEAWRPLLALSVLGVASFNTLLYHAAHTTTATNISLILTAMPALIVLMDRTLFGERASGAKLVGAGLAMVGAVVVVFRGRPAALASLDLVSGDLWMSLAVVAYALYSVLLRRRPAVHGLSLVAVTFAVGALVLLPAYVWEASATGGFAWTRAVSAGVIYAAVFPSILSYLFWNRGVALAGPTYAGLFICLGPVFTAVLAVPLLGESLEVFHLAGFVIITSGLVLSQRG